MPDFPTLTVNPEFPFEEEHVDSVIRTAFEAGYEHTRPRFTREIMIFHLSYPQLPDSDKVALEQFLQSVRMGADSFNWTHPKTSVAYLVRFLEPPRFRLIRANIWDCSFRLKTV